MTEEEHLFTRIDAYFNKLQKYRRTTKGYGRARSGFIFAHFSKWSYDSLTIPQRRTLLLYISRRSQSRHAQCCPKHNEFSALMEHRRHAGYGKKWYRELKDRMRQGLERCVVCGTNEDLTIDHILPINKGGTTSQANTQVMCSTCNEKKADKLPEGMVARPMRAGDNRPFSAAPSRA